MKSFNEFLNENNIDTVRDIIFMAWFDGSKVYKQKLEQNIQNNPERIQPAFDKQIGMMKDDLEDFPKQSEDYRTSKSNVDKFTKWFDFEIKPQIK